MSDQVTCGNGDLSEAASTAGTSITSDPERRRRMMHAPNASSSNDCVMDGDCSIIIAMYFTALYFCTSYIYPLVLVTKPAGLKG
jgi:hypothetical protein